MVSTHPFRTWLALAAASVFVLALGFGVVGCGDDSPSSDGGGGDVSSSERLNDGITGLSDFGTKLVGDPSIQFALSPQIIELVGQLFPEILGDVSTMVGDLSAGHMTPAVVQAARALRPTAGLSKMDISDNFGTYDRDLESVEGPYPGWVLAEAGVPEDGLVFRFDGDDDIFLFQDDELVVAEGEIRMINVVLEEITVPGELPQTVPTSFDFEVDAGPAGSSASEVLLRIAFGLTYDAETESFSVSIGDENSTSTGDPDASFIGPLFFAFSLGYADMELGLTAQMFDSTENFGIRFAATATGLDLEAVEPEPTAVNFQFAFGETSNPATPPFLIDLTLDEFNDNPETPDALVEGSVSWQGNTLATMAGDTDTVPVVIGEETVECPNVLVTFVDDPENPVNICVAMEDLFGLLEMGGAVAKMAGAAL